MFCGRDARGTRATVVPAHAYSWASSPPPYNHGNGPVREHRGSGHLPRSPLRRDGQGLLADNGIDSFIVADDVHVPLQLTEGARLSVMESEVPAAYEALERAGLLPESIAEDMDPEEDRGED